MNRTPFPLVHPRLSDLALRAVGVASFQGDEPWPS
jgi:hypothetical protein